MALAASPYSLVPRPCPSDRHFTLPSSSFASPQQINSFSALSFRPPKNPSPLRVLSIRRQSKDFRGGESDEPINLARSAPKAKTKLQGSYATVVTGQSWNTLILDSKTPVLVEFYASWCGTCQMVHRVIDEIATEYAGKLRCYVLNADQDPQVTEEYDIKAVPIVLLFKNGEKRESVVGTMPKEFYVAAIERVLSSSS